MSRKGIGGVEKDTGLVAESADGVKVLALDKTCHTLIPRIFFCFIFFSLFFLSPPFFSLWFCRKKKCFLFQK